MPSGLRFFMVPPGGFEPSTPALGVCRRRAWTFGDRGKHLFRMLFVGRQW